MGHTLVVEVSDAVYRRLRQAATAVGKSVQQIAADNLAGEPLTIEPDLPEPYRSELIGMAVWSEEALRRAMVEVMDPVRQRRYHALLGHARTRDLTERERADLDALRDWRRARELRTGEPLAKIWAEVEAGREDDR